MTILVNKLCLNLTLLNGRFPVPRSICRSTAVGLNTCILSRASFRVFKAINVTFLTIVIALAYFAAAINLVTTISAFFTRRFPILSCGGCIAIVDIVDLLLTGLNLGRVVRIALPLLLFICPVTVIIIVLAVIGGFIDLSGLNVHYAITTTNVMSTVSVTTRFFRLSKTTILVRNLPLNSDNLN